MRDIDVAEKARRYDMIKAEYMRWIVSTHESDDTSRCFQFLDYRINPMIGDSHGGWTQEQADEHLKEWLA